MIPYARTPYTKALEGALARTRFRIAQLHQLPPLVVTYVTGGGAGIQNLLVRVPGASQTLLDARFPYGREAIADLIGDAPQQFCSNDVAIRLAVAAHARARELAIREGRADDPIIGLGLTASLQTIVPKRGGHRVFLATAQSDRRTDCRIRVAGGTFQKERLTREEEGVMCDLLGIEAICAAAGIAPIDIPYCGFASDMMLFNDRWNHFTIEPQLLALLADTVAHDSLRAKPLFWPDGTRGIAADLDPKSHLLFPGSFNPFHYGHEEMATQAERMTGMRVVCTVNATHPDKGTLSPEELLRRAEQFRFRYPFLATWDQPLFVDKARAMPGFGILVGADAVLGLLNSDYYEDREDGVRDVLAECRRLGVRFHVVGRTVDGRYRTLDDLPIPHGVRDCFLPISGRWDVRSRDLR